MDKYLVAKFVSRSKKDDIVKLKVQSARKRRKSLSKKLIEMNRRTRDEVMPDDERALLQKEMLMISAFLDKTAKVSITRYRKRCPITGWARGLKCGIRRNQFREYASFGQIAGLIKA